MFKVYVEYYDEYDCLTRRDNLFVCGFTFKEVIEKLTNYYGENTIENIQITPFSPDDMLIFKADDEYESKVFAEVETMLARKVIW